MKYRSRKILVLTVVFLFGAFMTPPVAIAFVIGLPKDKPIKTSLKCYAKTTTNTNLTTKKGENGHYIFTKEIKGKKPFTVTEIKQGWQFASKTFLISTGSNAGRDKAYEIIESNMPANGEPFALNKEYSATLKDISFPEIRLKTTIVVSGPKPISMPNGKIISAYQAKENLEYSTGGKFFSNNFYEAETGELARNEAQFNGEPQYACYNPKFD